MRESHNEIQTTKKEPQPVSSNRKAKPINTHSKKLNHQQHKNIKKKLSFAFTPITEHDDIIVIDPSDKDSISEPVDVIHQSTVEITKSSLDTGHNLVSENVAMVQHPEHSIEVSSVSEAFGSNEDRLTESMESYIVSSKQLISPPSATTGLIKCTPSSSSSAASLVTVEDASYFEDSVSRYEATTEDLNSFSIQSMVNDLRESMCQVLNSADLESEYKKLFDALVKMVLAEEVHSLNEEKDNIIVLLSFVLAAIVAGSVGFLLFSDFQSSYYGPPPT